MANERNRKVGIGERNTGCSVIPESSLVLDLEKNMQLFMASLRHVNQQYGDREYIFFASEN
jgi:hypothetical protein